MQACDSLADAYARGLIHRDVKPANLFVCRKGSTLDVVKLLDFGLVKRWQTEPGNNLHALQLSATLPQHTGIGQVVGTPAFLAPEAALGEQTVDHRADLYALGCVGYWMLTGELVFKETSAVAMAVAHVMQPPEPLSKRAGQRVEPGLEAIVMSCLAKNRDQRPSSAEALRSALSALKIEPWSREQTGAWWQQHLADHIGSPL